MAIVKIVACHNYYQLRGGEDQSFEDEVALLRRHGEEVVCYTRHNDEIADMSRASVALQTLWNRRAKAEFARFLKAEAPDVVHFTNTFPLISPSCYAAARDVGLPVVQALRNYRLLCANGFLMRDGQVCQQCVGKSFAWPAIRHGCYRQSRAGSAVVACLQLSQRLRNRWRRDVDLFYTLTHFSKEKLVNGGLPADRVVVKPNCVAPDPGVGAGDGGFVVFVGRLSPEKGITTLMDAWRRVNAAARLKIIGGGPLSREVASFAAERDDVEYLGELPLAELLGVVGAAQCLAFTSIWYETFGRTIIEAYAKGTPVVASRLGAMEELVQDGETGFHFRPGDADDLAQKLQRILEAPPAQIASMRRRAREEYERRYTPTANYLQLRSIYDRAREVHARRLGATTNSRLRAISPHV